MWFRKKQDFPDFPKKLVEDLNEILKIQFAFLFKTFQDVYSEESEDIHLAMSAVVLKEIVHHELNSELLEFRIDNAEQVQIAKQEVMKIEEFKLGILSYLASKGAMYKSWGGHPEADILINEARRINPEVHIPSSMEEAQDEVSRCLLYYETLSEKNE